MELFKCTVRLAGQITHEVPRLGVSEKEMQLLRDIHGSDGVVNVKKTGSVDRDEATELMFLAKNYGKERVERCFHVKLDNFDTWMQEQREQMDREADEELEKRTRPAEGKGKQQSLPA